MRRQVKPTQLAMDRISALEMKIDGAVKTLIEGWQSQEATLTKLLKESNILRVINPLKEMTGVARNDNKGEPVDPVEQTTLLKWPAIKRLLETAYAEDYVLQLEEQRDLISIHGRRESSYIADDTVLPTSLRPTKDSGHSTGLSTSDSAFKVVVPASPADTPAEIDRTGSLGLDARTARRYFQSYLESMHKLHPFLCQNDLTMKVNEFIRCYCARDFPLSFNTNSLRRGKKRRRSYEDLKGPQMCSASAQPKVVEENIDNAITLLVFAIGAFCEQKALLLGSMMDEQTLDYRHQPIAAQLALKYPCPPIPPRDDAYSVTSALYISNSGSTAQEQRQNFSKHTISTMKGDYVLVKNHEGIPGLALYGYAAMILGLMQGGIGLPHLQARLLAALYADQLVHPLQSHGWVCQAVQICQALIRQKKRFPGTVSESPTQDLFNFAYWTCVQLESDLLVALNLPASNTRLTEGEIHLPRGRFTIDFSNDLTAPAARMLIIHSARIHLRKILNHVQFDLYRAKKKGQFGRLWSETLEALSANLELWRENLPNMVNWKDNDPPAAEINAARMRAEYYDARYMIHRPSLYSTLNHGQDGAQVLVQSNPTAVVESTEVFSTTLLACRACIQSAIHSSTAFDGVEDRLILTNYFGIAQTQCGNMLVLSATYNANLAGLSDLVDRDTLERLLIRTIKFLRRSQIASPTIRANARMLIEVFTRIFDHEPDLSS
ncbi:hypothetical protein N7539_008632 [Penicillium diatomitis]|uniref:Transcription factor domain-containing protein n=1 Tax=Penicillium diatomitis TaxID=2819901 RepID=A0A9W9WR19_9EURO|nr:uncharacterized protein N7539_008632 [Penicillium diatomitis]KAJ5472063.1 hypothetical protein N7539_008632 [Penicillium diatomitis]